MTTDTGPTPTPTTWTPHRGSVVTYHGHIKEHHQWRHVVSRVYSNGRLQLLLLLMEIEGGACPAHGHGCLGLKDVGPANVRRSHQPSAAEMDAHRLRNALRHGAWDALLELLDEGEDDA